MKKVYLIAFSLLLLGTSTLFAQKRQEFIRCYTVEMDEWRRQQNPKLESPAAFESWLEVKQRERAIDLASGRTTPALVTIPVIVHIIHNGDGVGSGENISAAQINSQIDVLNEDFRKASGTPGFGSGVDSEIQFCMATKDPNGNSLAEPGIHRANLGQASWTTKSSIESSLKPQTSWDPNNYLNIWVCKFGGGINNLLGYAQFPTSSGLPGLNFTPGAANTDGVVIRYTAFGRVGNVQFPYDEGRTTTHEIGHWLGLRHIWGDGGCSVDDYCTDTPESDAANYNCPTTHVSCGTTDQVRNYMDYTNDACTNMFTACQKSRMQTVLANSPRRSTLGSSTVCSGGTSAPVANFTSDVTSICPGGTVQFTDQSTNNPTSWSWTFQGGNPASSTTQSPLVSYANGGTYNVSLTVTNANGSNSTTQNGYITVNAGSGSVFWSEDFENNGVGWSAWNPDGNNTWVISTVAGNSPGTRAAKIDIYNNNFVGTRDGLISPVIDLTGKTSVSLDFEHAHRRFSTNEQDSLSLYVSTDGGTSFPFRVWGTAENGSGNFATGATTTSDFTPSQASDWCIAGTVGASCFNLNLSQFDGEANVVLLFEAYNDYGNNIYIDNIALSSTCSATGSAPTAAFNANETSGCSPLNVTFFDQSIGSATSWSWSFTGGNPASSTAQSPSVTYSTPGTYNVTMTASNAIGSNSITKTAFITVFSNPPKPVISVSGNSLTTVMTGSSYQWFLNGNPITTGTSQSYTPTSSGAFTVTVVDANGCSNTSDPYQYDFVGIDDMAGIAGIQIYPNPASNQLWLRSERTVGVNSIELLDRMGRVIQVDNWSASPLNGARPIGLEGIAGGIYFVRISAKEGVTVKKFTVLK